MHYLLKTFGQECASSAAAYIQRFQPGTYVVPNVPLALCDAKFPSESVSSLCECWPVSSSCSTSETQSMQGTHASTAKEMLLDELPILGRILSSADGNGRILVQWMNNANAGILDENQASCSYATDFEVSLNSL